MLSSKVLFASKSGNVCLSVSLNRKFSNEKSKVIENSNEQSRGWISKILTGQPHNADGKQKQSHSSLLSNTEAIYEIQTHDAIGGKRPDYLKAYKKYADEVTNATPGAEWFGSWFVLFGNQDQAVNLWRYKNGYNDIDNLMKSELEYGALCGRRRTIVTKAFSYWGDPKPRKASHVYDLRSYVLRPGSMIEWGNAWSQGIAYRREYNQDVAGFFAQIGQLYMVFHIWAYESMVGRNTTRQHTWSKPGWDNTVAYTVPLIKKMQSRILVPTEYSQLK